MHNTSSLFAYNWHWNTGLVSSPTSWGEYGSLALVDHPSSDGVTIKIFYGVDVLLNRTAMLPNYSYCTG